MSDDAGILLSHSVDLVKLSRRAANIGARILQGAKPAEIPVEQFDDYDLIVNLKTARALGLKIPYSILITARRIIE